LERVMMIVVVVVVVVMMMCIEEERNLYWFCSQTCTPKMMKSQ